jgi:general stress protein YciG
MRKDDQTLPFGPFSTLASARLALLLCSTYSFMATKQHKKPAQKRTQKPIQKGTRAVGRHFFPFDPAHAREIAKKGGTALHIYVFLLLCRGAGKANATSWTSHAAGTKLGFAKTEADEAIAWLIENAYLKAVEHSAEELKKSYEDHNAGREAIPMRYLIVPEREKCFLPNSLIPALADLYEATGPLNAPRSANKARLDQILLLLLLYEYTNMKVYGGVSPAIWTKSFDVTIPFVEIPGAGGYYLGGISPGAAPLTKLIQDAVILDGELNEENIKKRIVAACDNLKRNKVIYENLYVFEPDNAGVWGEIYYILYHMDEWIRNDMKSNYLAKPINDFCRKNLCDIDVFKAFQYDGSFHSTALRKFSLLTYDHAVRVNSILVPYHLPQNLDVEKGREHGFTRNVERIEELKKIERQMTMSPSDSYFDSMSID